jgi:hypothetical protein
VKPYDGTDSSTTPRLSRAYAEGRDAAGAGVAYEDNPFDPGTPEAAAWARGYRSIIPEVLNPAPRRLTRLQRLAGMA